MKKIISVFLCALCPLAFLANAGETATNSSTVSVDQAVTNAPQSNPDVDFPSATSNEATQNTANDATPADQAQTTAPVANDNPKASRDGKKGSWWNKVLSFFKIDEPKRTCEDAFNDMVKNPNVIIDFSNVSDFAQNGEAKMTEYYQKIKSTKSFGSKSPNLYVNLSKTGVTAEFVAKWSGEFAKDKRIVIWNLSDNENLDDSVIDALDLQSTRSLNLNGTSVTDAGIAKIGATIETQGVGKLVCVHISDTKVTDAGAEALRASFQKGVASETAKSPNKVIKLLGTNNTGVVYDKVASLPQHQKMQKPINPNPEVSETADVVPNPDAIDTVESVNTEEAMVAVNGAESAEQVDVSPNPSVEDEANKALNDANELVGSALTNGIQEEASSETADEA